MAFLSKFGNLLKQAASKPVSSNLSVSKPSIFQAIRCLSSMSSSKLFIGGASHFNNVLCVGHLFMVLCGKLKDFVLQVCHIAQMNKV